MRVSFHGQRDCLSTEARRHVSTRGREGTKFHGQVFWKTTSCVFVPRRLCVETCAFRFTASGTACRRRRGGMSQHGGAKARSFTDKSFGKQRRAFSCLGASALRHARFVSRPAG